MPGTLQDEYLEMLRAAGLRQTSPLPPVDDPYMVSLAKRPPLPGFETPDYIDKELVSRARSLGPRAQAILDMLDAFVRPRILEATGRLEKDVIVREFPTGSCNAQACAFSQGVLILLNSGLLGLLDRFTRLWGLYRGVVNRTSRVDGSAVQPDPMDGTLRQMVGLALLQLASYRESGHNRGVWKYHPPSGGTEVLRMLVLGGAEAFVVAHEYGHLLAGHLDENRMVRTMSTVGDIRVVEKSRDDEMEADAIAVELLLSSPNLPFATREEDGGPVCPPEIAMQILATGPVLFFVVAHLDELVISLKTGLQVPSLASSHPPSLARLDAVVEQMTRDHGDAILGIADEVVDWGALIDDRFRKLFAEESAG